MDGKYCASCLEKSREELLNHGKKQCCNDLLIGHLVRFQCMCWTDGFGRDIAGQMKRKDFLEHVCVLDLDRSNWHYKLCKTGDYILWASIVYVWREGIEEPHD